MMLPDTRARQEQREEPPLKVTAGRRPLRWVAAAGVLVLLAMAANALVTNPAWEWEVVGAYLFAPSVLRSVLLTLELTVLGIVLGFALGTVLALMRLSPNRFLSGASWAYVWLFRSVPLILQLLFWYNLALLYPRLSFGVPFGPAFFDVGTMDLISPLMAAVLGLALHQAAYAAEIVRTAKVDAIAAQVPPAVAEDGELTVGFNGEGTPPLVFPATDDTTLIGVETDLAHLVGDVLELEVKTENSSWENSRYGPNDELRRYPPAEFARPYGAFLVLVSGGETIAGGAFRRYDPVTAELKRVWTHPEHRRRGLGVQVVRALEEEAERRGYRRIYLTTGPRQPEAAALYLATGYTPLFDVADFPTRGPLGFEKTLPATPATRRRS
jgi:His/Glu/Gln/Arg/opine family amino acid ABC transporter permease subunit